MMRPLEDVPAVRSGCSAVFAGLRLLMLACARSTPAGPPTGDWLQLPTLAGLMGLLIAIQGIRDSGWVQHAAATLVPQMHSLRRLGLLLVAATALLSMVLTNDVSLFLMVPLTVAIGRHVEPAGDAHGGAGGAGGECRLGAQPDRQSAEPAACGSTRDCRSCSFHGRCCPRRR